MTPDIWSCVTDIRPPADKAAGVSTPLASRPLEAASGPGSIGSRTRDRLLWPNAQWSDARQRGTTLPSRRRLSRHPVRSWVHTPVPRCPRPDDVDLDGAQTQLVRSNPAVTRAAGFSG